MLGPAPSLPTVPTARGEPSRSSAPVHDEDEGGGGDGAAPGGSEVSGHSRVAQLNILVVDDEREICDYLADFLHNDGYRCTVVSDPTRAISVFRSDDFHICILDLMMPRVSGIDLLGQIRKIDDDIAVIILTGFPSLESATVSIEHEVSAYVRKPFDPDEFRALITRIAKKKGLILRREDDLHQTIGRNIRAQRKARGLTLKQMSRRTNLSVSLLSQIERAESSASVSSLYKVATALDLRLTELFGDF